MSHFTVAVITEDMDYETMLEPFYEQGEAEDYFMCFEDLTEDVLADWEENRIETCARNKVTGEIVSKHSYSIYRESYSSEAPIKPDWEIVEITIQERYKDFDTFAKEYHGYAKNENDRYGYYFNPDAKWDWYSLGGRWKGMLLVKADLVDNDAALIGESSIFDDEEQDAPKGYVWVDQAMIKDVEWELMKEIQISKLAPYEDFIGKDTFYRKEYIEKMYPDEATYVNRQTAFSTFAVLDQDGWHEKGQMGWFGLSSESPEEAIDWELTMFDRFIKTANPEHYIAIVDCHI